MPVVEEMIFQGSALSEGIAIGRAVFLNQADVDSIPTFCVERSEIDQEIERYRRALFSSREDLHRLQGNLADEGSFEAVEIIGSHIEILQDPFMTTQMESKIRESSQSSESVFCSVITEYEEQFSKRSDAYFKQRLTDIMDLAKRILNHLRPDKIEEEISYEEAVIFSEELNVIHVAKSDGNSIIAFVAQTGGGHSHAALIAKAKGIPAISLIDWETLDIEQGAPVIVDGDKGILILHPSVTTLNEYKDLLKQKRKEEKIEHKELEKPLFTKDQHPIELFANVSQLAEIDHLKGADGIGLVRTEYFFLTSKEIPSEEDQIAIYSNILNRVSGEITFRLFDFCGDKIPLFYPNKKGHIRGITFLLEQRELLHSQIRAILIAGKGKNFTILLPTISDVEEVLTIKKAIQQEKKALGINDSIPVGCMIEIPSAALIADFLAAECDFFSLGTNDLIHYLLGINRFDSFYSNHQSAAHPAFFRMLENVIKVAKHAGKKVCLCGDIASNPLFIPILLAFGITRLSIPPRKISEVRKTIFSTSIEDMIKIKKKIMKMSTSTAIIDLLNQPSSIHNTGY